MALSAAVALTGTAISARLAIGGENAATIVREQVDPVATALATTRPRLPATSVPDRDTAPSSPVVRPSLRSTPRLIADVGTRRFSIAPGESKTIGTGHLVTYSVEIEEGLPYSAADIANVVDRVLADQRGWTAVIPTALQRVAAAPIFRIRLATPAAADDLCAPLDTGGRLSCRNGEMVVLNAWRWANGARAYGDDLKGYRTYMVNHEFGHALGNTHSACPSPGDLAPVMAQQTKGLDGCQANPWPTAG